jgi:hypothetical protein
VTQNLRRTKSAGETQAKKLECVIQNIFKKFHKNDYINNWAKMTQILATLFYLTTLAGFDLTTHMYICKLPIEV